MLSRAEQPQHVDAVDQTRRGVILHAESLVGLAHLRPESVDLAYIDPPFNTGSDRRGRAARFADRFESAAEYVAFIRARVAALHALLRPEGSLLLHCDWRHSHHLRLLLDELFGPERFVNHLIWAYGLGGSGPRSFARKHDDILFYAKGADYWFEAPRIPATSRRMQGRSKKATDVLQVPSINNAAAERTGYPTQKPLALLRMLVGACCPPDGLVVDCFCGSGTALVAAVELGRRAVGIDCDETAVAIARRRLALAEPRAPAETGRPATTDGELS
ncbi:MAG TPA: site-specific DNA-methyltransferase [Phycisphaerales bacterium]|nr:site-specific DNA-methyltransferase [Phycisphaerales bacterium]HMP38437.1 site-specific DNA-methyltransferase [Phycisphaerales bacterium]